MNVLKIDDKPSLHSLLNAVHGPQPLTCKVYLDTEAPKVAQELKALDDAKGGSVSRNFAQAWGLLDPALSRTALENTLAGPSVGSSLLANLSPHGVNALSAHPTIAQALASTTAVNTADTGAKLGEVWSNLDPATRSKILGGAIGGTLGGGFALTSLSVQGISSLLSHPVGFVVGLTALGIGMGVLTPKVVEHFKDMKASGSVETPLLWNVVLPTVKTQFQFATHEKPAGPG